MDSMEIDFDLDDDENDPIKEFLRYKLEEVKSASVSLENDLKTRSDLLKLSERRVAELRGALKIREVWKRTFHSKCVFGIVIENSSAGNFKFTEVFLNWNSPTPLTYYVKFYDKNEVDEWLPTNSTNLIRASATAVVVLEKAPFLKQMALDLEGFIKYVGEPREYQLPLPRLRVSAGDFTDPALEIQRFKLLRGADEEFLSYLTAANDVTEFVGELPGNGRRKVESLLEIDCMLKRLDVKSRKKYFLVDGISCNIDGCLLEVYDSVEDGLFYFNILSRSQEQLRLLLHYLHRSAQGISILPKSREVHLKRSLSPASQSFSVDEHQKEDQTCSDLRRKLLEEISCIENFFTDKIKNGESSGVDYARFRSELSELEAHTDALRVKCDV